MTILNVLDNLPEDPTEPRQVSTLLAAEVKALTLKVEQLQHQLHGANRHPFGSTSESMDQLQLFAENEEIAKVATEVVETAPCKPVEPKAKPKRKPLPDHLDRIEEVLLPVRIAPIAEVICQSWAKMSRKNWNTSRAALS